jgi:hypothetical protein
VDCLIASVIDESLQVDMVGKDTGWLELEGWRTEEADEQRQVS